MYFSQLNSATTACETFAFLCIIVCVNQHSFYKVCKTSTNHLFVVHENMKLIFYFQNFILNNEKMVVKTYFTKIIFFINHCLCHMTVYYAKTVSITFNNFYRNKQLASSIFRSYCHLFSRARPSMNYSSASRIYCLILYHL